MKTFSFDKAPKSGKVILWSNLILLSLGLIIVMLAYLNDNPISLLQIFSSVGVLVFALILFFLWLQYANRQEVRDKNTEKRKLKTVKSGISKIQLKLSKVLQKTEDIRRQSQQEQETVRDNAKAQVTSLEEKITALEATQQEELKENLRHLQLIHVESGLRANDLDPQDIPGVGELLIEKLNQAGILTAFDVKRETIQAIPGFGDSKTLSILRWQSEVERGLVATQPTELPPAQAQSIKDKYTQQLSLVQKEKEAAGRKKGEALAKLQEAESLKLAATLDEEKSIRGELEKLEVQKLSSLEQLKQYEQIRFVKFLHAILTGNESDRWQNRSLATVLWLAFFALGSFHMAIFLIVFVLARFVSLPS